ncbi:MAG: DUF416 family protein [Leptospiraceae bacterium]|nr:DUF416 family protein [Leptospiraceae bacterium]MCP5495309.1 DUF416 family protein [Leptospiraceae bacterium]
MNMNKAIQNTINQKISLLSQERQLAFGIILSERFLPNYFAFYFVEKWGNPMVLLNGIDLLKNIAYQGNYETSELELIDELIESITPDLDDFPSNILASMALDVSSMLCECFVFVKNHNIKHIEICSSVSFGSLEMYVQKRDNLRHDLKTEELNKYFSQDSLIKHEIEYQLKLLDELTGNIKISPKLYIDKTMAAPMPELVLFLSSLQDKNRFMQISNI